MKNREFIWYDRKEIFEKYEDGEYCKFIENGKNIGKYYNYDLNKWDYNKRSNIDYKYIRYEFEYKDDRQILNEFGWENVDKVGKFLYLIYKKSICRKIINEKKDSEKWIYIDKNEDEKEIFGNDYYIEIRNKLIDLKWISIKVGNKNKFKRDIILYRLNKRFYNCEKREVLIKNRSLIKKLEKRYLKKIKDDDLIKNEIENCKCLDIVNGYYDLDKIISKRILRKKRENEINSKYDFYGNNKIKFYENKILKYDKDENQIRKEIQNRFELLIQNIKEVKLGDNELIFRDKNYGGRLYNIVNSVDKEFRELLRLDGEELVEVDMVCGYVSLLFRLFKVIRNENNNFNSELDDELRYKLNGVFGDDFIEFYNNIVFGERGIDFYSFIYLKLLGLGGDKLIRNDKRNYIKSLIINLINGKNDFIKDKKLINQKYNYNELCKTIFRNEGFKCLNKLKEIDINFKYGKNYFGYEKYKNVSKILNLYEVEIISEKCRLLMYENIKYINMFDGLLVKKSEVNRVLEIINKEDKIDKEGIIKFKKKGKK